MPAAREDGPWRIWADTGGTFTDCLAIAPDGSYHRTKVLSNAALRGTAVARLGPATLRVDAGWPAIHGLIDGFRFRRLDDPRVSAIVRAFEAADGILRLDIALPPDLTLPFAFEVLSADEAPILAARILTRTASGEPLPAVGMRLATTRGTNALLERRGARVAFFVTEGFGDVLRIGTQQRPDLFARVITRADPVHEVVVEVPERVGADGRLIRPLDEDSARRAAASVLASGVEVAAVSLVNAYANATHEIRLGEILREAGFAHVSLSSRIAPSIGHHDRSKTTLVNAYLDPIVSGYVSRVEDSLSRTGSGSASPLYLMTSTGGLVRSREFRPRDSLLSGPAGGVVGAVTSGRAAGVERVITFDMGGTSTDVARYDGSYDYVWRHAVGDVELLAPALAVESVAAGGGSVCEYGLRGLTVGPRSAGADPGPACYGAGGPLTITDCNLLLGRLDPSDFSVPLDHAAAVASIEDLLDTIESSEGHRPTRERLASGLVDIANERMADAIRAVSLRRGYDPSEYALVVFGGAGAQHGCGVADRLGIRRQIVPRDAGLLSAWGLGRSRVERIAELQILRILDSGDVLPEWLRSAMANLEREALTAVVVEGVPPDRAAVVRRIVNARIAGQDATVPLDLSNDADPTAEFRKEYERTFGHPPDALPIEIESLRIFAAGDEPELESPPLPAPNSAGQANRRVWFDDGWREVPCHQRNGLAPGEQLHGPCLILERHTTVLVAPEWSAVVDRSGAIILDRLRPKGGVRSASAEAVRAVTGPDPVRDQLFTSRFESIVSEMGEMLRRTALSTNVKERLDFSCALLDAAGELVANAPHIPVHLGALGICVRSIVEERPLRDGDVVVTNHPAFGGSHLPDLTVVSPVHHDGRLLGYVANRAHHAEIGGCRPGSMPPTATRLVEEGVVIPPTLVIEAASAHWDRVERILSTGPYPTRALRENLADLRAQVAANHRGASLLRALAASAGPDLVAAQMASLTARAERGIRSALRNLGHGTRAAAEYLDDGSVLAVRISIDGDGATFDFEGTSPPHPRSLNATPAIVRSAVLYFLRLLIDEPIPLNEGLLRPVRIVLPASLLNPDFTDRSDRLPAVVGGNTEVSQRLVDTLIRAIGIAACSQGTMNNLLWGTDDFGYYETIAGGEGASPGHQGCDAVHTHMTNTRITDTESLERRYPVRVDRFAIRAHSGGEGAWRGGNGIVREFTFLAPMSVSVLTQHRREGPFGYDGGRRGAPGRQWVEHGGERVPLQSIDGWDAVAGDRLVIETPGGGGWGKPHLSGTSSLGSPENLSADDQ